MLVQVYGVEAVSKNCVFEWFEEVKEGVKYEPRSGQCPKNSYRENITSPTADCG
ncbi:hypothetical protein C0J52_13164 [Blattella germanica]|nr:hypothetical protein C0J52_13164 [Blattella germanica]